MVTWLDCKHTQCRGCSAVIPEYAGRRCDISRIVAHLTAHAREVARSSEKKAIAAKEPDKLPPVNATVCTQMLTGEQLQAAASRAVPAEQLDLFFRCLGKVWDVEHPWPGCQGPKEWDRSRVPVLLYGTKKKDATEAALLTSKATDLRRQRRRTERQTKQQKRVDEEEVKLEVAKAKKAEKQAEKKEEAKKRLRDEATKEAGTKRQKSPATQTSKGTSIRK
ncbi:hypothetical protein DIPPA_20140 [Diplonema papillatum]|nr:hypothetical protein DIPPA_20140 [Diplonema papillatum]